MSGNDGMSKKLYFYYGTMASAKTLRLLTTAYNFEENHIRILVMKPSLDVRDGDGIIRSRVGLERPCMMADKEDDLFGIVKRRDEELRAEDSRLEWVLVDECQFLTEKQVEQLAKVVDKLDISVMCVMACALIFSPVCFLVLVVFSSWPMI